MQLDSDNGFDATDDSTPSAAHTLRVQQLFVKHQPSIRAFILSLLPDFTEAEDVLQEVFLTVTRKAGSFGIGTNFQSWSFAIARFKVLEARRRSRHLDRLLDEETLEALCVDVPEEAFGEGRQSALHQCLQRLAPRAQEVVRLRYFNEHGPEEIARLIAWSPGAVNSALHKARLFLRQCVERRLGGIT